MGNRVCDVSAEVPTVNYHLWQPCNMSCGFCFATFEDLPVSSGVNCLPESDALGLIGELWRAGFGKINFAGGEPILCPWLHSLIRYAKSVGFTTSIVTNGSKVTEGWLDSLDGRLDIAALSVDSVDADTLGRIGRAVKGKRPFGRDYYLGVGERLKGRGIRLKVNTVVNRYNLGEDFRPFIREMRPERWKIFQALRVEGQNDGRMDNFAVTPGEFEGYVGRNRDVADDGVRVVAEGNELMTGSYLMVDPLGRFFDNTKGRHTYSRAILAVGVAGALEDVEIYPERFTERGGFYP